MKSLMEEASSISKAIEKGWTNAGKPKEFTIKIYEEPEKNFIGMTTKPAKIGIFFTEPKPQQADTRQRGKQREQRVPTPQQQQQSRSTERAIERAVAERAPVERAPLREQPRREPKPAEERPPKTQEDLGPIWGDDMILSAKEWITEILQHMGFGHIQFTIAPQRFHLKINFAQSVLEDKDKQKHLFAILSGLLLTMLKRQYKRPLRGYKIVLTQES